MDKHQTINIDEYLVYEDKQKLNTLKTTLSVRQNGAYLSLIGVDTPVLLDIFKNYLLTFKNTKIFHYKSEQIIDEIISSNEEQTLIIDIFNLKDDFKIENIIQNFRFNRDFIPYKNIRIFIIASNETLDKFSEKAYDFVTFANFYGQFKNNKFDFEYKVNRGKLDKLIQEYKVLEPNTSKLIQIEKIILIVQEAEVIGEIETVFKYLKVALNKALKLNNDSFLGAIYTAYGKIYMFTSKYEISLKYYIKAQKLALKLKDKSNEAMLLNNIGNLYYSQDNDEEAMKYYKKSLKINQDIDGKVNLESNYSNIASIYKNQNNYDMSFEYYNKALKLTEDIQNKESKSNILLNMGVLFASKFDLEKALNYFELSYQTAKKFSYTDIIIRNLFGKGLIFFQQLNFKLSLKYFNESLMLSKKFNFKNKIDGIEYHILEVNNIINGIDDPTYAIPKNNSNNKDEIIRYMIYNAIKLKEQKNFIEVKEKLQEAEKLADEINLKGLQCEVYMAFYDFYKTIQDEKNAQSYYNKANYIIKNSGHKLFEKRLEDIKESHNKS